jgi:hypothetical protein
MFHLLLAIYFWWERDEVVLKSGSSYSISIYSLKTEQQMNWSNAHIGIKKFLTLLRRAGAMKSPEGAGWL